MAKRNKNQETEPNMDPNTSTSDPVEQDPPAKVEEKSEAVEIPVSEPLKVGDKVTLVAVGQIAAIGGGQAHVHILNNSVNVPVDGLKRA